MSIEVEQKFPCASLKIVRQRLLTFGAEPLGAMVQRDCYFNHPVRDFAQTDEAFRLRQIGAQNFFTYKGPKLDAFSKTRVEREIALEAGPAAVHTARQMVLALGFRPAAEVVKRRETLHLRHSGGVVAAALDDVEGVGTFVELEVCVDADDPADPAVAAARRLVADLAQRLEFAASERRSYLELFLQANRT